jgi:hypothetical protein
MKNLPARLRKHADEVLDPGYQYYGTPEMVREAADEIERLTLTHEEREAIEWFSSYGESNHGLWGKHAASLLGLLERTKVRS